MDSESSTSHSTLQPIVTYSARSSVGRLRTDNQDSFGMFPDTQSHLDAAKGFLFVVADGMGGHRGGCEASATAVASLHKTYFEWPHADVLDALRESFRVANAAIYEKAQKDLSLKGMGTTCTALVLADDSAYLGHIGDSRAYRVGPSEIIQATEDHSRAAELFRNGLITAEEARTHPERSMLVRALGVSPDAKVDFTEQHVGDREICFLLCSDGVSGLLNDAEIHERVWPCSPQEACKRLIDEANARGGHDNATAIVVRVQQRKNLLSRVVGRFW